MPTPRTWVDLQLLIILHRYCVGSASILVYRAQARLCGVSTIHMSQTQAYKKHRSSQIFILYRKAIARIALHICLGVHTATLVQYFLSYLQALRLWGVTIWAVVIADRVKYVNLTWGSWRLASSVSINQISLSDYRHVIFPEEFLEKIENMSENKTPSRRLFYIDSLSSKVKNVCAQLQGGTKSLFGRLFCWKHDWPRKEGGEGWSGS